MQQNQYIYASIERFAHWIIKSRLKHRLQFWLIVISCIQSWTRSRSIQPTLNTTFWTTEYLLFCTRDILIHKCLLKLYNKYSVAQTVLLVHQTSKFFCFSEEIISLGNLEFVKLNLPTLSIFKQFCPDR